MLGAKKKLGRGGRRGVEGGGVQKKITMITVTGKTTNRGGLKESCQRVMDDFTPADFCKCAFADTRFTVTGQPTGSCLEALCVSSRREETAFPSNRIDK